MRKIIVAYWISKLKDLEYEHCQQFDYSLEKQHEITENILSKGYSAMIIPDGHGDIYIWVDTANGRFKQR